MKKRRKYEEIKRQAEKTVVRSQAKKKFRCGWKDEEKKKNRVKSRMM